MEHQELDQQLRDILSTEAPSQVQQSSNRHFARLRRACTSESELKPLWRRPRALWWGGLSFAGMTAIVVLGFGLFFPSNLSWAQVVERFRALPSFNATVYVSRRTADPPEKIEIWAAQGSRTRIHYRGLILLARGDQSMKVLNSETGQETDIDRLRARVNEPSSRAEFPALQAALDIHEKLGRMREFSLDGLLDFFRGTREQLSPVPNLDPTFASDMQVFDFLPGRTPAWLRVWVLKQSELPVRLRFWDPRDGEQVEVVFDYVNGLPAEAFDPAKVQAAMRQRTGRANRLYALLKDPAGRQLTPADIFTDEGYHLPVVESVGRTTEGVLWVLSRNAINRRADGQILRGFGKLRDDLQQDYARHEAGHLAANGQVLEYFIPLDYGIGFGMPTSYTLTCWDRVSDADGRRPTTVIGTMTITNWDESAAVPGLFTRSDPPDSKTFLRRLLSEHAARGDWDRLERLAASIPGTPEDDPLALHREMQIETMLEVTGRTSEAAELRARLYPLVRDGVTAGNWPSRHIIQRHLADLVRDSRTDEARRLASVHVQEALQRDRPETAYFLADLIATLRSKAGMREAELRRFFDQDILGLPAVRAQLEQRGFFRDQEHDPETGARFAEWRAHVAKVAERYRQAPLPAGWALLAEVPTLGSNQLIAPVGLPGHPAYRVTCLYGGLQTMRHMAGALKGVEAELVTAAPVLTNRLKPMMCVYHTNSTWQQHWRDYFERSGVHLIEQAQPATVLVARYDGRKLPNYREVEPLDASPLGAQLLTRAGGASTTVRTLLREFQRALNHGRNEGRPPILIEDQTGLAGRNSGGRRSPCLAYEYAFWTGPGVEQLTFDWFRTNFGITFRAETREVPALELRFP